MADRVLRQPVLAVPHRPRGQDGAQRGAHHGRQVLKRRDAGQRGQRLRPGRDHLHRRRFAGGQPRDPRLYARPDGQGPQAPDHLQDRAPCGAVHLRGAGEGRLPRHLSGRGQGRPCGSRTAQARTIRGYRARHHHGSEQRDWHHPADQGDRRTCACSRREVPHGRSAGGRPHADRRAGNGHRHAVPVRAQVPRPARRRRAVRQEGHCA